MTTAQPPAPARDNCSSPTQLSVEQALQRILDPLQAVTETETLPIDQALGRIVATPILAPIPVPGDDNSAMDGYALNSDDFSLANSPGLPLSGRSMAGHPYDRPLPAGSCVRIMTGAVVPTGADTVVMQEQVELIDDRVVFPSDLKAGNNIRLAGEDLQLGQVVLASGHLLKPADIGLLASLGLTEITLFRKIRVAFFSTGDELITGGTPLQPGQIYDSNRHTLTALLQLAFIEPLDLGLIGDQPDLIRSAFQQASAGQKIAADVIITSGGVSVGDADYVKEILDEQGEIDFWRIAIKPGRPLAFGKIDHTWFFGLPGNPVSSYVTFDLFTRPALYQLAGAAPVKPLQLQAKLTRSIGKRPGRTEYQRGHYLQSSDGSLTVASTGNQSSGVLSSISLANCYIVLSADSAGAQEGEPVTIEPFTAG